MADADRPPLAMTPTRKAILEDADRGRVNQYGGGTGTYWGGVNGRKANQWTDAMEAADWLAPERDRGEGDDKAIPLRPTETGRAALAAYLATRKERAHGQR